MHPSIIFSLRLMHLHDASAVKSCSPFSQACFVPAERPAVWQVPLSSGAARAACRVRAAVFGYPSSGPGRTGQGPLGGSRVDPSHL